MQEIIPKRLDTPDYRGETNTYRSFGYQENPFHPIGEPLIEKGKTFPKLINFEEQKKRIMEFIEVTLESKKTTVAAFVGEYGTGKTHFLKYLEKEINNQDLEILKEKNKRAISFFLKPFYRGERDTFDYDIRNLYRELERVINEKINDGTIRISKSKFMQYLEKSKRRHIRRSPLESTISLLGDIVKMLKTLDYDTVYLLVDQIEDLDKFESEARRKFALELRELIASNIDNLHFVLSFTLDSWYSIIFIHEALETRFPKKYLIELPRFTPEMAVEFTEERVGSAILGNIGIENLFYRGSIFAIWRACNKLPRYITQVNHVLFYRACLEKRKVDYEMSINEILRFGRISRNILRDYLSELKSSNEKEVLKLLVGEFGVYTTKEISRRLNIPLEEIEQIMRNLITKKIITKIEIDYNRRRFTERFGGEAVENIDQKLSQMESIYALSQVVENEIFFPPLMERHIEGEEAFTTSIEIEGEKSWQGILKRETKGKEQNEVFRIIANKGKDYQSLILDGIAEIISHSSVSQIPSISSVTEEKMDSHNLISYWGFKTRTERKVRAQVSFFLNKIEEDKIKLLSEKFDETHSDLAILFYDTNTINGENLERFMSSTKTYRELEFRKCSILVPLRPENFDLLGAIGAIRNKKSVSAYSLEFLIAINFESRFQEWYNAMQDAGIIIEDISRPAHELLIAILQDGFVRKDQMNEAKDEIWKSKKDRILETYLSDLMRLNLLEYIESKEIYIPRNSPNERMILNFISRISTGWSRTEIESFFISSRTHFDHYLEYLELKGQIRIIDSKYYLAYENDLKKNFQEAFNKLEKTLMERLSEESQHYLENISENLRKIQKEFEKAIEEQDEIVRRWKLKLLTSRCSIVWSEMEKAWERYELTRSTYEKILKSVNETKEKKKEALLLFKKDQIGIFNELDDLASMAYEYFKSDKKDEIMKVLLDVENGISRIKNLEKEQKNDKEEFTNLQIELENNLKLIEDSRRKKSLPSKLSKELQEFSHKTSASLDFVNEFTENKEYGRAAAFIGEKNNTAKDLIEKIELFEKDTSAKEERLIEELRNTQETFHNVFKRNKRLMDSCQPIFEEIEKGILTLGYHQGAGDHREFDECQKNVEILFETLFDNISEDYREIARYIFLQVEEDRIIPKKVSEELGISTKIAKDKLRKMADDGLLEEEFRK